MDKNKGNESRRSNRAGIKDSMKSKKKVSSKKKPKIIANPNQRFYILKDGKGQPVSYQSVSNKTNSKKKQRYSFSVQRDYRKSLFPRTPPYSPISRLKYGNLLQEMIQDKLDEKIANAAAGSIVSVGSVSSIESLKPITELELEAKFGTTNITSNFERPYDDIDYTSFHDSVRSDGMTRSVSIKRPQYIVGEFTDLEFVPNFKIEDEDEKNKVQDDLNSNELLNSLKAELKKIDEKVDFFLALHGILIHSSSFGQGLIGMETDGDNIPIALKLLSGMRIGRLFKDRKTWELRGVEYLDYSSAKQENILLATKIIYMPNLDYNIGPNTSGYGLSDLETIRHIAEQNIILNQMDIKEANAKYHTPRVWLSVANAETPQDILDLGQALEESQSVVSDLDGEAQVIDNTTKVLELVQERDSNDAAISRYYDVPQALAGFENAMIKASTSQVLYAWTQSSLLKAREVVRVYIERQYYMRNLKAVIERRLRRLGLIQVRQNDDGSFTEFIDASALKDQSKEKFDPNAKLSENGLPVDENGAEIIKDISSFKSIKDFIPFLNDLTKLPFKLKMTFEPITIDGLLEKAATVVSLKNARIINNMYSWKILKFKDLIANPPKDLEDIPVPGGELMMRQNGFGANKGNGVGNFSNLNIENLVTQRGRKPKPKLNTSG